MRLIFSCSFPGEEGCRKEKETHTIFLGGKRNPPDGLRAILAIPPKIGREDWRSTGGSGSISASELGSDGCGGRMRRWLPPWRTGGLSLGRMLEGIAWVTCLDIVPCLSLHIVGHTRVVWGRRPLDALTAAPST